MALEFLLSHSGYKYIEIYYVGKVRVQPFGDHVDYFDNLYIYSKDNYDECDEAMTKISDFDIAWIRPGRENSHTANNIRRRYGL
jgi:hypothetical protein